MFFKGQVKFSALINEIKGSVAGTTFQAGKVAKLIRSKDVHKLKGNKGLSYQSSYANSIWSGCMAQDLNIVGYTMPDGSYIAAARSNNAKANISQVAKSWGSLLESDRQHWSDYARNVIATNKLGERYTPSGYQLYMQTNTLLVNSGFSPVARAACIVVTILDEEAQETMTCLICGPSVVCWYDVNTSSGDERIIKDYSLVGPFKGTGGVILVSASAPVSPGKQSKLNTKLIAVLQPSDLQNYILGPTLNKMFGANLAGQRIQLEFTALLPSGTFTKVDSLNYVIPVLSVGSKIAYTRTSGIFSFTRSATPIDFGITPVGTPVIITIIVYGQQLIPNSVYTIGYAQSGLTPAYSFAYGNPADPLPTDTLTTDKYGNILPIPLEITFDPASAESFDATITFSANSGAETLVINLTGSGS